MTEELLGLIWVIEATLGTHLELAVLLDRVLASSLIPAADLPQPTVDDRSAPDGEASEEDERDLATYTPDFWKQREARLRKVTPQEEDSTLVVREMRDDS
jgi:hypothetical protein